MKLLDMTNTHIFYREHDPLFWFLTNRQMMLVAAMFECGVGYRVWVSRTLRARSLILFWFCAVVATYKVGLDATASSRPCSCLGVAGELLRLNNGQLELITWVLLGSIASIAAAAWVEGDRVATKGGEVQGEA
jgi:hypothetical protein